MKTDRTRPPTSARASAGFTLIEVMMVVAILAILLGIALPNYRTYVLRGHLVDATNLLSTFGANMERYYQDNRTYAAVGTITPPCAASGPSRTQGSFTVSCTTSGTGYTLTAAGSGTTAAFSYTLNELGNRATTIAAGGPSGWNSSGNCWVVKGGQSC